MKKRKLGIFVILFLLLAFSVFAAQINSASYKQNVIVSTGGENVSSSSYRIGIAVGIINAVISSGSYINKLGFFHTILLADGQPCTSANQCEGGFCCSNSCASSACPSGAGGGGGAAAAAGGGGGAAEEEKRDFSISPSSIKEKLALGAEKTIQVNVRNTGNTALSFALDVLAINEFVSLSESRFSLDSGQEKAIEANIIGRKLGSYFGAVEAAGDGIKKSIDVVIDVISELVLFDVKLDIPSAYKEVEAGGELKVQISLLNVGPARNVDVTPTYLIKNRQGGVVYESSETFAVEKQTSYVKSFKMPKELQPGDYLVIVEVRYANSFAVSSELFRIVAPKEETALQKALKSGTVLVYTLIIVIVLMSLFVYLLMPKLKVSKTELEKCYKAINDAEKALDKNDMSKARKLYAEAKKLYFGLETEEKKEIYVKLTKLYNKLR